MLIEQSANANRWSRVSPAAKGVFSLCGVVAAYAAASPAAALGVAGALVAVAVLGAGIAPGSYLRVAAPALFFLGVSALSLAVSLEFGEGAGQVALQLARSESHRIAQLCSRSLGALSALLFLSMTTPLSDLIALLRRLGAPEVLLDLMVLCYRTLFVFSEAVHDTTTAQSARLGYATARLSLRSLGAMVGHLTVQIWQRSQALHLAALARNNDGPLRFLEREYTNSRRDQSLAFIGGAALIGLALVMP